MVTYGVILNSFSIPANLPSGEYPGNNQNPIYCTYPHYLVTSTKFFMNNWTTANQLFYDWKSISDIKLPNLVIPLKVQYAMVSVQTSTSNTSISTSTYIYLVSKYNKIPDSALYVGPRGKNLQHVFTTYEECLDHCTELNQNYNYHGKDAIRMYIELMTKRIKIVEPLLDLINKTASKIYPNYETG